MRYSPAATWILSQMILERNVRNETDAISLKAGPSGTGGSRKTSRQECGATKAALDSVLTEHAYHATLNLYVLCGDEDGFHLGIGRLQTNLARALAIEALQGRIFAADQRHDDVAAIGDLRLLADDVVAIHDVILNHGAAFDLQNEGIAAARKIAKRKGFTLFDGLQRPTGGDAAHERKLLDLSLHYLILDGLRQLHDFDRAALVVAAADESFLFKRGDVLVHRRQRSKLQALANLFETRRVPMFGLKRDEVIQNFFLPLRQGHVCASILQLFPQPTLGEKKANVKPHFSFPCFLPARFRGAFENLVRHLWQVLCSWLRLALFATQAQHGTTTLSR